MKKPIPAGIQQAETLLNLSAKDLKKLTSKRMFGCHAVFADGAVFGLVWKDGRIGVKLPDSELYNKLMACDGAAPWRAGTKTMSHWVLVPEDIQLSKAKLKKWVHLAHKLAVAS